MLGEPSLGVVAIAGPVADAAAIAEPRELLLCRRVAAAALALRLPPERDRAIGVHEPEIGQAGCLLGLARLGEPIALEAADGEALPHFALLVFLEHRGVACGLRTSGRIR